MVQDNYTAGVVLVGGKSSRMGSNKALLQMGEFRLVDYIANVLRHSGIEKKDIYVSGDVDGFPKIVDLYPNKGPVGGICSSLMECYTRKYKQAVIVPVDMPLFSPDLVKMLIEDGNFDISHFQNNPLPLCIKIDEETLKYSRKINKELKNDKDISVKAFLKDLNVKIIKAPEKMVRGLANTNTPEEWREVANEYKN